MPGGLSIFAKALNVTEGEFLKMMETGKLTAVDVLPKVTVELRKAARANGALDQALKSVSVTEGQFITQTQKAGDKIFKSGFGEGLSELYMTLTSILKDAGPQLEKIGKIFGTVFKAIAHILKLVEPPLKLIINNIEYLTGAYMIRRLMLLRGTLATTFLPITAALAAAEELVSLFSDKLVGATEMAIGRQINFAEGTSTGITKRDGKYYSVQEDKEDLSMASNLAKRGPVFGTIKNLIDSDWFKSGAEDLMTDTQRRATRSADSKFATPPIVNQTTTIEVKGVSGEDVAFKIKEHLTNQAASAQQR